VRQDVSLIVYDVSTITPVFQVGSEAVQSADWFCSNTSTFVAGKGMKGIKIFDLRVADGDKNITSLETRSVHGITCDPFTNDQFASYDGEAVSIWDRRRLTDPLVIMSGVQGLSEIHWSDVKSGRLVGIGRDDPSFWTWDIQSGVRVDGPSVFEFLDGKRDEEGVVPKPVVCKTQKCMHAQANYAVIPISRSNIRSISWIPTDKASYMKVLTVHEKEDSFKITRIFHHFCVAWSPFGNIAIGAGKDIEIRDFVKDVSTIMRERAVAGYSLAKSDVVLDDALTEIWSWISSMLDLVNILEIKAAPSARYEVNGQNYAYRGVDEVVHDMFAARRGTPGTPSSLRAGGIRKVNSESNILGVGEREGMGKSMVTLNGKFPFFRTYESGMRRLALGLCGRGFVVEGLREGGGDEYLEFEIDRLEGVGLFEKAACYSIFYNADIPRAVRSLNSSKGECL
jgi:hypothetical protein